jgi:inhibitor of KinA sporulation pathway (predicted exonuclease)
MSHDIMIDLETLATTPDAAILSIGAVRFDLDTGRVFDDVDKDAMFYTAISVDSQKVRVISSSTLAWWFMQSQKAQAVFFDDKAMALEDALEDLAAWIDPQPGTMPTVWSNGADFDLPMLVHAYEQHDATLPWAPYSGRCYRTYKNLPGARAIKTVRQGEHHNALDDAIFQARHLCAIHQALFQATAAEVPA